MYFWKWSYTLDSEITLTRADSAITTAVKSGLGSWRDDNKPEDLEVSRTQIQELIEKKKISLNSKPLATPSYKLQEGDTVEVEFAREENYEVLPVKMPLEILFEDDDLIVINKPQGLSVHPSVSQAGEITLVHGLLAHCKLSTIGAPFRPGIVHRIDKNTSGSVVMAKTDRMHVKLAELFSSHSIERKYWAFAYGKFERPTVKVETLIGRSDSDRKKMAVVTTTSGKNAITYFKTLEAYAEENGKPFASLIEATLETGRTHQVRVHLNHLGNSIIGDPSYGKPTSLQAKFRNLPNWLQIEVQNLSGQMLHAKTLGFIHPITSQKIEIDAPLFPQFLQLFKGLKEHLINP